MKEKAKAAYEDLVNQMMDLDEEVGTLFLEEKPVTREILKQAIRRQTIAISPIAPLGPRMPICPTPRATIEASPSRSRYRQSPGSSWCINVSPALK